MANSENATKSLTDAWLVGSLKQTVYVSVLGREVPLEVKDLADGCVGVSLWFDTLEHATEYAGDKDEILKGQYEVTTAASSGRKPTKTSKNAKEE